MANAPVTPISARRPPVFESQAGSRVRLGGVVGDRIRAAIDGWLVPAPEANPAITEMFFDRDDRPARDMVPWAGEFAGKYLTSAVLVWRMTGDDRLRARIEHVVERLLAAQGLDGYLGPWPKGVRLVEKWDVWGHYHVMLGLLLWHRETDDARLLDAARRIVGIMKRTFVDGGKRMLTPDDGDGEKNHAISHAALLLHRLTGDPAARELAEWIAGQWEQPPAGQYMSAALAGKPVSTFVSHRWESAHDWQAIAEWAFLTGDDRWARAFQHIWWGILEGDRHNTGGFTSSEACQGNPYDRGAIETCCTISWIALTVDMLRMTGDPRVADEIELATLNGYVGGQHPSGRWWTYNTPMDGIRNASAHDIVFQARSGAPELNCCSVNAPRGLGAIGEWAVMASADGGIVLNGYGPGETTCPLPSGGHLSLRQETTYPLDGAIAIRVGLDGAERFALMLRIPGWSERTMVALNGEPISGVRPGTYLLLDRKWADGDVVTLALDFTPHFWVGERESARTASIYVGPILLAYDPRFDVYPPDEIPAIDLRRIALEPVAWKGPTAPWLLVRVKSADGRTVVLCDYASAGATGRPYRSWLPATGLDPVPFDREKAVWALRA